MKIGITGINGMIGWHLRAYLHGRPCFKIVGATRETFEDVQNLRQFVSGMETIVHLAGMNRGGDAELEAVNISLTEALVAACEVADAKPHIVFASSTHIERDTAYGRSKRECADLLRRWADKRGTCFTNMILPNVFGEFGKPFSNSVVSTFCHQLACGENPAIIIDGQLELIHAQQVAERILLVVTNGEAGDVRMMGMPLKVSALLGRLEQMAEKYVGHLIPNLSHPLDLQLFNTYRSYLFPDFYPVSVQLYEDDRGHLFEAVRALNHGQLFLSTTHPGITRGNHYHRRKVERFLVVQGTALIRIRKLFTPQVFEFRVKGTQPAYIDIPTFHSHSITNVGSPEMITLFWANEIFDPSDADTYPELAVPV